MATAESSLSSIDRSNRKLRWSVRILAFITVLLIWAITWSIAELATRPSQREAELQQWYDSTTPAQRVIQYENTCLEYGHEPNTAELAECIQTENLHTLENLP